MEEETINITIRKANDGSDYSVDVSPNCTMAEFRTKVAEKIGIPEPLLKLIFSGQVLPNTGLISERGIVDGVAIHATQSHSPSPPPPPPQQPQPQQQEQEPSVPLTREEFVKHLRSIQSSVIEELDTLRILQGKIRNNDLDSNIQTEVMAKTQNLIRQIAELQ